MTRYLIILILLISTVQSQAQFLRADYKKAELIYHRPLAVALLDLEDARDECDSLRVMWFNETIREVMPGYWTLNDSVIFMEKRLLTSIIGSKSPEYAVFSAKPSQEGQQSSNDIFWSRSYTFMLFLSEDGRRLDPDLVDRNSPIIPDTDNGGQLLRGRYIFKLSFADHGLSTEDLIFAIGQIDDKVNLALEKRYSKKGVYAQKIPKGISASLQNITLLIPNDLDPEGIDEKIVSRYYEHPFRIASQDEITAAIKNKEENTAYIHYMWSDQERMFLGSVIGTQNGSLLAVLKPGSVKVEKADCLPSGISYRTILRMKAKKLKGLSRLVK